MPMQTTTAKTAIPNISNALNLKLVPIGNSLGIRLSRPLLNKYGMHGMVVVEQRADGILLRGENASKLSLEQTFVEMAASQENGENGENWDDWHAATLDGLDKLVW